VPGLIRRSAYRMASRVLGVWRYVRRPTVRGVRCVLVRDDEVLLVRHTYGDRRWSLPGGLMRRGEDPDATVRREMQEELALEDVAYRSLGVIEFMGTDRARHLVTCFTAEVDDEALSANPGEIAETRWFPRLDLPAERLDGTGAIVAMARRA
jgi:ADP-ribose pyrophosphatase YjhB (NUDIX family)